MQILNITPTESDLPGLIGLLMDSVHGGASIGFLAPLNPDTALDYWQGVVADVQAGSRIMLIAQDEEGKICGAVQLSLCGKANGAHRAEVEKLMVHSAIRRGGLGRRLMQEVERAAASLGRTLLVLDTQTGSGASFLYTSLSYIEAGHIPGFAASPDGTLDGTTLFYKQIAAY